MSSFAKVLDRLLFAAIGLLLAAMMADVTIQVFFRYVVQNPPTWTEEVARFLFAWEIFLAAGLAFGRGSHIVVDALLSLLPRGGRRFLAVITNVMVLGFLVILMWQGINMVRLTSDTFSAALNLNMGVVYASLPLGSAISAVYIAMHLFNAVCGKDEQATAPSLMMD